MACRKGDVLGWNLSRGKLWYIGEGAHHGTHEIAVWYYSQEEDVSEEDLSGRLENKEINNGSGERNDTTKSKKGVIEYP